MFNLGYAGLLRYARNDERWNCCIPLWTVTSKAGTNMEEQIRTYHDFLKQELSVLGYLPPEKRAIRSQELYLHSHRRITDFQHERLIHLLVTLFFGAMLSLTVFIFIFAGPALALTSGLLPVVFFTLLILILLVLEIFYIKHYFFLENNIQDLYRTIDKIWDSTQPTEETN
jgi:hypothetical protein